jgi:hypothetical protein
MHKRMTIMITIVGLLAIMFPYQQSIRNAIVHTSNKIFGIDEPDTTDDTTDCLDIPEPDHPGLDSSAILQGIDSIEMSTKRQEIIPK